MAIVVAILLALFVLPPSWGWTAIGLGIVYELATTWLGWRWSRSRRDVVGPAALVGLAGEATESCRPDGWVKVQGELWHARCPAGVDSGASVRVRRVEGLTLVVDPERS